VVKDYREGLSIIEDFINDPNAYWGAHKIPREHVATACHNLKHAGVPIPPYIEQALGAC
jgi:hypothetical protein